MGSRGRSASAAVAGPERGRHHARSANMGRSSRSPRRRRGLILLRRALRGGLKGLYPLRRTVEGLYPVVLYRHYVFTLLNIDTSPFAKVPVSL